MILCVSHRKRPMLEHEDGVRIGRRAVVLPVCFLCLVCVVGESESGYILVLVYARFEFVSLILWSVSNKNCRVLLISLALLPSKPLPAHRC